MRPTIPLPTLAELQSILSYEPDTGLLRWLVATGKCRKGSVAGGRCGKYIAVKTPWGRFYAHRIAWRFIHGDASDFLPGPDHIDRNGDNNSADNLRVATEQQQAFNRRSRPSSSGFRGVTWHRRAKRWRAKTQIYGKGVYLGQYGTPEEAYAAYLQFVRDHHGEFAYKEMQPCA